MRNVIHVNITWWLSQILVSVPKTKYINFISLLISHNFQPKLETNIRNKNYFVKKKMKKYKNVRKKVGQKWLIDCKYR
ncbi:hypothetical protein DRQ15_07290 [candidate division KSB1 bacterium]|nr:MAG: hypothetical protein DRQ11_13195 [candidate division KSB1 bacterium]RKY90504.1 MAG: hypothetical protein DRQ15_07290 [candidate division KSB1 bacterium]